MSDFVRVNFYVMPSQHISISGREGNFSVEKGTVFRYGTNGTVVGESDGLIVRNGERFDLRSGAHDSCTLRAIVEATRKGVELESYSQPNGFPARMERVFVEAR